MGDSSVVTSWKHEARTTIEIGDGLLTLGRRLSELSKQRDDLLGGKRFEAFSLTLHSEYGNDISQRYALGTKEGQDAAEPFIRGLLANLDRQIEKVLLEIQELKEKISGR